MIGRRWTDGASSRHRWHQWCWPSRKVQLDYTVAQLGADRLVWGGHGPSRSYATELSKVFDSDSSDTQRRQIFGGNLRRIATPIFRRKGYSLDP